MFSNAIAPNKDGSEATNQQIVDRLSEDLTTEKLNAAIKSEISRLGFSAIVALSDAPAPERPKPGAPDIPGAFFYSDNRTMFEDFRSAFYGVGFSEEAIKETDELFNKLSGDKEKRIKALGARISAIQATLPNIDDPVIKTEMEIRLRQLSDEQATARLTKVPSQKSVAQFAVELAKTHSNGGLIEIRAPHIAVRRASAVIIDWGFVLIDVATYEGA